MKSQFIIAAPSSNSGKTLISLGLIRAITQAGKSVAAFKCGPDYIDPKFHQLATGNVSSNLDSILMPESHLKEVYSSNVEQAEVCIVEGVMGMFDGAIRDQGSSADLAKFLGLPIVLVVNAKSTAFSVAPLIHGFASFDPKIKIAGVIFNQVNTPNHFRILQEACESINIPCFGYVRSLKELNIPSRHLGLSIADIGRYDKTIDALTNQLSETVQIEKLLSETKINDYPQPPKIKSRPRKKIKIAVAKDEAFNFIYAQNILQLEKAGKVSFFSPLEDEQLPEADMIYLPGGYPECYLEKLSANLTLKNQIRQFADDGGKILAECGGFMYLGREIESESGTRYDMVNAMDTATSMRQRKLHLGYRTAQLGETTLLGHEFHYSTLQDSGISTKLETLNIRNEPTDCYIYKDRGILGSYMHFYFGSDEQFEQLWNLFYEDLY